MGLVVRFQAPGQVNEEAVGSMPPRQFAIEPG